MYSLPDSLPLKPVSDLDRDGSNDVSSLLNVRELTEHDDVESLTHDGGLNHAMLAFVKVDGHVLNCDRLDFTEFACCATLDKHRKLEVFDITVVETVDVLGDLEAMATLGSFDMNMLRTKRPDNGGRNDRHDWVRSG